MLKLRIPRAFCRFFLSYIIIFCIPTIALSSFFYTHLISKFEQMTYHIEEVEQQKKSELMDGSFEQIKKIAMQFGMHEIILPQNLRQDINARMELMEQLRELLLLIPNVDEIIFWMPGQELFYSSQSSYSANSYLNLYQLDLESMLAKVYEQQDWNGTLVPTVFASTSESQQFLYFSCPYPYTYLEPQAYLIFRANANRFVPVTDKPYRLSQRGNLLLDYHENTLTLEHDKKTTDNYVQIQTISPMNGFELTTVSNNDDLFASFYQIKLQFIFYMILACVLCIFLLSLFSYRHSKPFTELGKILLRLGGANVKPDNKSNEVSSSITFMQQLYNENQELDLKLLEEQIVSRSFWLSKLINQWNGNDTSILEHLETYGVSFKTDSYTVAIICLGSEAQANQTFDDYVFSKAGLDQYYYIDLRRQIILIVGGDEKLARMQTGIYADICQKLLSLGYSCTIYGGGIYHKLQYLHNAYIDVLSIMPEEHCYTGDIHLFNKNQSDLQILYPQVELSSLRDAVSKGDVNRIQTIIHDITFQMERIQHKPIICKTVCYEIANVIGKSTDFIGEQSEIHSIINQFLVHLNQVQSRMEILELLCNLGNDLNINQDSNNEKDEDSTQISEILEYISINYTDSSFYLGDVASRFGISQNNLSQQLKRALGISPNKYINALRIDKAKHLLVDTDMSIKDISMKVGFSDASSFIRNFKAITSTTPSVFRSEHTDKSVREHL